MQIIIRLQIGNQYHITFISLFKRISLHKHKKNHLLRYLLLNIDVVKYSRLNSMSFLYKFKLYVCCNCKKMSWNRNIFNFYIIDFVWVRIFFHNSSNNIPICQSEIFIKISFSFTSLAYPYVFLWDGNPHRNCQLLNYLTLFCIQNV